MLGIQTVVFSHHGLRVPYRHVRQSCETSTVFTSVPSSHGPGGRDLSRLLGVCSGVLESSEKSLDGFRGEVLVVVVVDLDHGCVDASTETLDFDEGEKTVFRGVAGSDTQVFRDGIDNLGAAAATELARCLNYPVSHSNSTLTPRLSKTYRRAQLNKVLANRLAVVHSVEGCDFVDTHRGHLQEPGDLVHDTDAGVAVLTLTQVQHRHNGSLLVLRGVPLKDLIDKFEVLLGELEGKVGVVGGFVAVLISQLVFHET